MYTLLYWKWITNKDLLYSTGNSPQCYVAAWMGGKFGGEWIHTHTHTHTHTYIRLSPFAVHLKLPQYCSLAIPQYKIISLRLEKKLSSLQKTIMKITLLLYYIKKNSSLSPSRRHNRLYHDYLDWKRGLRIFIDTLIILSPPGQILLVCLIWLLSGRAKSTFGFPCSWLTFCCWIKDVGKEGKEEGFI